MDTATEHRLTSMRETAEWLEENYSEGDTGEVAKNIGMMKGDLYVLLREL